MRISEHFNLELTQTELEFVDVDTVRDVELFIDPAWIHIEDEPWFMEAALTLSSFFNHIIELYENGDIDSAKQLFDYAHEPNETCFGLSVNNPNGTGASADMLGKVFDRLLRDNMFDRGFVSRLEDIHVFIEDFGQDRLSDLVTNIIRKHLVDFTKEQCEIHNIPINNNPHPLAHYWNRETNNWLECNEAPLIVNGRPILLVPKNMVVKYYRYSTGQYCTHHVLVRRAEQHKRENSHLVRQTTRKDGTIVRYVNKKDIIEEEIVGANINLKQYVLSVTEDNPELIQEFRNSIAARLRNPITTNRLTDEQFITYLNNL